MFSFGNNLKMTIFGASHQSCVGVCIEGLNAGFEPDFAQIDQMLERRKANKSKTSTTRHEKDEYKILSGLFEGKTCGAPLVAIFENKDTASEDYKQFVPRPNHSDYSAFLKYGQNFDYRGGGFFSGRMTVAMCFAGAIAKQILQNLGVKFSTSIEVMGDIHEAEWTHDSIGGKIKCIISNFPQGVGEPFFDGVESVVAHALFSIPAIKGVEFGKGFEFCHMKGSEANDQMQIKDEKVSFLSNNCGGILGGITNGQDIVVSVAFKPTPSIAQEQDSVDLQSMTNCKLKVEGRHDLCIVPRAVPVVESMTAFALLDLLMEKNKYENR